MTPEELAREEAFARQAAEFDATYDGDYTAGDFSFLTQKFPPPKTDGLTPEQAEAAMDAWGAEVLAFLRNLNSAHRKRVVN